MKTTKFDPKDKDEVINELGHMVSDLLDRLEINAPDYYYRSAYVAEVEDYLKEVVYGEIVS